VLQVAWVLKFYKNSSSVIIQYGGFYNSYTKQLILQDQLHHNQTLGSRFLKGNKEQESIMLNKV
jgi:hypothetical protein